MSLKITFANIFIVVMVILLGAVGLTTASNAEPFSPTGPDIYERRHP